MTTTTTTTTQQHPTPHHTPRHAARSQNQPPQHHKTTPPHHHQPLCTRTRRPYTSSVRLQRTSEQTNERTNERTDGRTNERMCTMRTIYARTLVRSFVRSFVPSFVFVRSFVWYPKANRKHSNERNFELRARRTATTHTTDGGWVVDGRISERAAKWTKVVKKKTDDGLQKGGTDLRKNDRWWSSLLLIGGAVEDESSFGTVDRTTDDGRNDHSNHATAINGSSSIDGG